MVPASAEIDPVLEELELDDDELELLELDDEELEPVVDELEPDVTATIPNDEELPVDVDNPLLDVDALPGSLLP